MGDDPSPHQNERLGDAPDGRYEFRCWNHTAAGPLERLQRDWSLASAESRGDIYLLTPLSDRSLVKLRDGERLEIKRRTGDVGRLQYWRVEMSVRFPLCLDRVRALGAAVPSPATIDRRAARTPAHLLAALWPMHHHLRVVPVRKARLNFRRGACWAEATRVDWDQRRLCSFAVEALDPDTVTAAVKELGLTSYANRSYGDVLPARRLATLLADRQSTEQASGRGV